MKNQTKPRKSVIVARAKVKLYYMDAKRIFINREKRKPASRQEVIDYMDGWASITIASAIEDLMYQVQEAEKKGRKKDE